MLTEHGMLITDPAISIQVREACLVDLPMIVEIYNEAIEDGTATCDLGGFTPAQKLVWFEEHTGRYPIWIAEQASTILGWTALSPYEAKPCFARTAMISTYVHRQARGQKVGTILRTHMISEAKRLEFHTLVNRVFVINQGSIALAKKFGFTQVGHMRELVYREGRYIDCVFFQLMLD